MDIWINLQIGCVESFARRIDTKQIGHVHDDDDDDDDVGFAGTSEETSSDKNTLFMG
jgi:hypothetical protein